MKSWIEKVEDLKKHRKHNWVKPKKTKTFDFSPESIAILQGMDIHQFVEANKPIVVEMLDTICQSQALEGPCSIEKPSVEVLTDNEDKFVAKLEWWDKTRNSVKISLMTINDRFSLNFTPGQYTKKIFTRPIDYDEVENLLIRSIKKDECRIPESGIAD